MTAAGPGQGGAGHFNEQPPERWVERFRPHGYALDELTTSGMRATGEMFCDNAIAVRRLKG